MDWESEGTLLELMALAAQPGLSDTALMHALFASAGDGLLTPRPVDFDALRQAHMVPPAALEAARGELRAAMAAWAHGGGISVCARGKAYPAALLAYLAFSAPPVIHLLGNVELLHEAMAGIVGAREASEAGCALARRMARQCAERGIVLVSGGAKGIDDTAQRGALEAGGRVVVVLAQGLLAYTPPPYLQAGLEADEVLVLSQWPLRAPWRTYAAVTRNHTISALARLLCVIEPRRQGGSIQTARSALAQGKQVLWQPCPDAPALFQGWPGATQVQSTREARLAAQLTAAWETPLRPPPKQEALFPVPPPEAIS